MAELSRFYVQRQLARQPAPGGGGGGLAPVRQPRIPNMAGAIPTNVLGGVAESLDEVSNTISAVARQRQKARDVAELTSIEATIDEQVAGKQQELLRDANIHPFDYREQLQSFRNSLLDSPAIPERLKSLAKAKVQASTEKYIIGIDAEGTKRGLDQAVQSLEVRTDQLIRQQVSEADPKQRDMIGNQIRELYRSYVESGILSGPDAATRLNKVQDTAGAYAWDIHLRTNTDDALAQLEQGYSRVLGISPETYSKVLDKARDVQRERYSFQEKREADTRAATERAQKDQEAIGWGMIRGGKMPRTMLNQWRDNRQISPAGYESMVRYQDTKDRENRALGLQARAIAQQDAERKIRTMEADLTVRVMTEGLTVEQVAEYGRSKGYPSRAMDGAMSKAQSRENALNSQFRTELTQAEQRLRARFGAPGPFDKFEDEQLKDFFSSALDELSGRSRAYGGQENSLDIVDEIAQKHLGMYSLDTQTKIEANKSLLTFPTPDELEANKGSMPQWKYEQNKRMFYQLRKWQDEADKAATKPSERSGGSQGLIKSLWPFGK